MHHILIELVKLLFSAFRKEIAESERKQFRQLHPDRNTKITILSEQFAAYFAAKTIEEKFQTEDYILKIIDGLKKENDQKPEMLGLLDDLVYELKFNSGNQPAIKKILRQL